MAITTARGRLRLRPILTSMVASDLFPSQVIWKGANTGNEHGSSKELTILTELMTKSSRSQEANYFRIFPWLNLRPSKSVPSHFQYWVMSFLVSSDLGSSFFQS